VGVLVDASSPARFSASLSPLGNMASAAFTAPADALLVLCVCHDGDGAGATNYGATAVSDSGGLAWTEKERRAETEATTGGASIIYTARTTSAVSRTITVARTATTGNAQRASATCYVLTGVDVDGTPVDTVSGSNEGGSATNNLTTTSVTPGANGLLVCVDCDFNALGVFQASSDLTQDTATYAGAISVCSGYKACSSGWASPPT
jgi:hypothetical protein